LVAALAERGGPFAAACLRALVYGEELPAPAAALAVDVRMVIAEDARGFERPDAGRFPDPTMSGGDIVLPTSVRPIEQPAVTTSAATALGTRRAPWPSVRLVLHTNPSWP
jgi:hypothetical protein